MTINLKTEQNEILRYIIDRVRDFPDYEHTGPGDGEDPIGYIELGFQFDQSGWVALVFDTRDDASCDGEWQSWIEETAFDRQHWFKCIEALTESGVPLTIVELSGKKRTMKEYDGEAIAGVFGNLLRDTLIKARDQGLFASLPLSKTCLMGVEEQGGAYGWPAWEDREKEGSVTPAAKKLPAKTRVNKTR